MTDDDKAVYRSAVVTGNLDEFAILYKDAARYRWLRDNAYHATAGPNGKMTWCVTGEGCSTEEPIYGEALDAAIDATMKTQNAKSQATDAALSRQVACTDGFDGTDIDNRRQ